MFYYVKINLLSLYGVQTMQKWDCSRKRVCHFCGCSFSSLVIQCRSGWISKKSVNIQITVRGLATRTNKGGEKVIFCTDTHWVRLGKKNKAVEIRGWAEQLTSHYHAHVNWLCNWRSDPSPLRWWSAAAAAAIGLIWRRQQSQKPQECEAKGDGAAPENSFFWNLIYFDSPYIKIRGAFSLFFSFFFVWALVLPCDSYLLLWYLAPEQFLFNTNTQTNKWKEKLELNWSPSHFPTEVKCKTWPWVRRIKLDPVVH